MVSGSQGISAYCFCCTVGREGGVRLRLRQRPMTPAEISAVVENPNFLSAFPESIPKRFETGLLHRNEFHLLRVRVLALRQVRGNLTDGDVFNVAV
jgi:hypothetical protein